jgi:hypothetical protein
VLRLDQHNILFVTYLHHCSLTTYTLLVGPQHMSALRCIQAHLSTFLDYLNTPGRTIIPYLLLHCALTTWIDQMISTLTLEYTHTCSSTMLQLPKHLTALIRPSYSREYICAPPLLCDFLFLALPHTLQYINGHTYVSLHCGLTALTLLV